MTDLLDEDSASLDLTELSNGDRLHIASKPLSYRVCEVIGVEVKDIGLTEIVVVTLLCGSERHAIEWATHSDMAVVVSLESDVEHEVAVSDITIV